ncbi:predicted protein [Sclerotinia sclerotiorum 1980 UF-70]|uniref:Uncharacterized protein n=2 Tax=Sclerotinia sclerotiorum (strain ATCC 18683 / 1980 / Ss-1) TaxID=665079 RepID=A0A1D9PUZ6_SCLS1|nr:predicted protein [Sclerotinia sclerotiorum 1980 UF-70]APA06352.1 hypothetical protein sscle_01g011220 [Sclerotinia sclerotiorum 1980 UF-70]EDN96202.1 predicted protein [Sclerotinia sclerotiorum 1980 UF-70]
MAFWSEWNYQFTLMRMISDSSIGGLILEIASNVPLSSGEYQWTVPFGLDINNVHFPPWAILSDCDGTQTLSGAFWVNDAAVLKRDDSNSIDKKARLPDPDLTVSTSMSSTSVGGDSSSSTKIGKVTSASMLGNNGISSSISISGTATSMINSTRHTHPTLFATSTNTLQDSTNAPQDSTNTPPVSGEKKRMHMIVGIVVGILGLFVLVIVYINIHHRDKHEQPLTSPWKMWSDRNAVELETTANSHELEEPGKFELHGTSMKGKIYELEGKSIKKAAPVDVGD